MRLHNIASHPESAEWAAAIRTLSLSGDGFTLQHLGTIDRGKLSAEQATQLEAAMNSLATREQQANPALTPELIVQRLERAAYADLMCDPLEGTLPDWTLAGLESRAREPDVQAELNRLAAGYTPTHDAKTLFGSMGERVPTFARRVLLAAGGGAESK